MWRHWRPWATLHLLGTRPTNACPPYLKGLIWALLPLRLDPLHPAMFPMKFFEYSWLRACPFGGTAIDALAAVRQPGPLLGAHHRRSLRTAIAAALRGEGPALAERLARSRGPHATGARTEAMLQDLKRLE